MTQQQFDIKRYHGGKLALVIAMMVLVFILITAGISSFAAVLLMWAWGLFMVPVFSLPLLSFSEAFGAIILLLIIRFAFGGRNIKK